MSMSTYWTNFIKSGDPNGNGLPEWKPYDTLQKGIMFFGSQPHPGQIKDSAALDFLAAKLGLNSN